MNKHKNIKTTRVVGKETITFDSRKEALRFDELYIQAKAGQITELTLQPKYMLMEKQVHNGIVYKSTSYIADFRYKKGSQIIVEDVKSEHSKTLPTYRVKVKWFLSIYGRDITFLET